MICLARFRRRTSHVPNLIDELGTAEERRMNQLSIRQNLERQKFDTSSAELVALCDVGATLIHTPLHSCAKPNSTLV
jgi:hypothetical protein